MINGFDPSIISNGIDAFAIKHDAKINEAVAMASNALDQLSLETNRFNFDYQIQFISNINRSIDTLLPMLSPMINEIYRLKQSDWSFSGFFGESNQNQINTLRQFLQSFWSTYFLQPLSEHSGDNSHLMYNHQAPDIQLIDNILNENRIGKIFLHDNLYIELSSLESYDIQLARDEFNALSQEINDKADALAKKHQTVINRSLTQMKQGISLLAQNPFDFDNQVQFLKESVDSVKSLVAEFSNQIFEVKREIEREKTSWFPEQQKKRTATLNYTLQQLISKQVIIPLQEYMNEHHIVPVFLERSNNTPSSNPFFTLEFSKTGGDNEFLIGPTQIYVSKTCAITLNNFSETAIEEARSQFNLAKQGLTEPEDESISTMSCS